MSAKPTEEPDARIARHLAMCRELAELGMDMARSIHAQREPCRTEQPTPDPKPRTRAATPRHETATLGLAFARIVRAVESILAFEARVVAEQAAIAKAARENAAFREVLRAEKAARGQPANPPPQTRPIPQHPAPETRSANCAEIPSLLATISREIGIDLQDPTLASRLPSFKRSTDPPE